MIENDDGFSKTKFMQLRFDVVFPNEENSYFIASNIPSTYIDILKDIVISERQIKAEQNESLPK